MNTTVQFVDVQLSVPAAHVHQSFKSLLLRQRYNHSANQIILDIPSFNAKSGEKICVVGRNGNGKTTFLKVLAGIYPASSGKVWTSSKPTAVLAAGIGLEDELTVSENIDLALILKGIPAKSALALKDEIIDFCELRQDSSKQFKHLSSGFRSRLAFAIAVSEKPSILVLDEVLGGGDEFFMKRANERLREIIDDAQTAFIATHAPAELGNICNRLIIIEKARIAFDGDFDEGLALYRSRNT